MRLGLALGFFLLLPRCTLSPDGVVFRCEVDGGCPTDFACRPVGDERYCVRVDGGATAGGSAGGGTSGGAGGMAGGGAAGGATAGGAAAGGSTAGGSTAGGSAAGGSAAGGAAAGGSTAGGSAAGGSTAGGSAAGGSAAGGSAAGGSAGGSAAGGSAAGGSAAGGSTAGGSTAGGSAAGGSTAGGSAGGAVGGGTAGGTTSRDAGFIALATVPNSRFVGIVQVGAGPPPSQPVVATAREPLDGGPSVLENWSPIGGPPLNSRTVTTMRVEAIAANSNVMVAIAGRTNNSIAVEYVRGASDLGPLVAAPLESLGSADAGITRLRMLETPTDPAVALVAGGSTPDIARIYRVNTSPTLTLSVDSNQTFARVDDLIHAPLSTAPSRLVVVARCTGSCSFADAGTPTTSQSQHRYGWVEHNPNAVGGFTTPSRFELVVDALVPVFDGQAPVLAASEGNAAFTFFGRGGAGELVVERRDAATGSRAAFNASTGAFTLSEVTQVGALTFVLGSITNAVTIGGTLVPWTPTNGRNVVLIRVAIGGALTPFTWDVPGDQVPVGLAAGNNGALYIALNEGPNAVLWRIPVP